MTDYRDRLDAGEFDAKADDEDETKPKRGRRKAADPAPEQGDTDTDE